MKNLRTAVSERGELEPPPTSCGETGAESTFAPDRREGKTAYFVAQSIYTLATTVPESTKRHLVFLGQPFAWEMPLAGSSLRATRLARELAKDYRVTFVTHAPVSAPDSSEWAQANGIDRVIVCDPPVEPFDARWGGLRTIIEAIRPSAVPSDIRARLPLTLQTALVDLRQNDPPAVVWAYRTWMAELAKSVGFECIVCDLDDFEHVVFGQRTRSLFPYWRYPLHAIMNLRLKRYELGLASRFNAIAVTKAEDLAGFIGGKGEVAIVPNGVDLPQRTTELAGSANLLLFVGLLQYPPNTEAVCWFADAVLPLIRRRVPDARFVVAGRGPVPQEMRLREGTKALNVEESPRDLQPLYESSRVVVAPIRSGAGTKIKVLEAMAYRRPVVATTEASLGHLITDGENILVADSAEDFAQRCVELLLDPQRAAEIASRGREFVEGNSTWDHSGARALTLAYKASTLVSSRSR